MNEKCINCEHKMSDADSWFTRYCCICECMDHRGAVVKENPFYVTVGEFSELVTSGVRNMSEQTGRWHPDDLGPCFVFVVETIQNALSELNEMRRKETNAD